MRKLLLIGLCLFALKASSQTIDTAIAGISAVKITPIKAKFTDTVNATHLAVRLIADNLYDRATLYYELRTVNEVLMVGNFEIVGVDYANWNGTNLYPFSLLGTKLNLIFLP